MSYCGNEYYTEENVLEQFSKIEIYAPKSPRGFVLIWNGSMEERYVPNKKQILSFKAKNKTISSKISKIIYNIQRNIYKIILARTFSIKKSFEYEWLNKSFKITYVELEHPNLRKYFNQWCDFVRKDNVGFDSRETLAVPSDFANCAMRTYIKLDDVIESTLPVTLTYSSTNTQ